MKKIARISSAAVLMVVACTLTSCEKSNADSSIAFKANCVSTKGVEITTESLKAEPYGQFYWEGFYPNSNAAAYPMQLATWKASLNCYDTDEFWPDNVNQALDFWCMAPVSQWTAAPTYTDNHSKMSFSFQPTGGTATDAESQSDLIVAYGGQMTFNQAGHYDHQVPLTFLHPLCGIRYKVGSLSAIAASDQVKINSVAINGVALSGTCTAERDGNERASFTWAPGTAKGSYSQSFTWAADEYAAEGLVLNTKIGDAFLMMVPQKLTSANSLTINWSIAGIEQPVKTANLNTAGIDLQPGNIYTFTLVLKSDAIEISILVDPWEEKYITL